VRVGDLVRARHWHNKELALVLSLERGEIVKVALCGSFPNGFVLDQLAHDLEVISEGR